MYCAICKTKNVTAGHISGHDSRGVPKNYSKAERKRRAGRLDLVRYRGGRKPGATNLDMRTNDAI